MKKLIYTIISITLLISCGGNSDKDLLVKGEIKNLKKGTLFLQKVVDTLVVNVDSVHLDGINVFTLTDKVESPEIYYLSLDNKADKRILFFGEPGTVMITTKLDRFNFNAEIQGNANQQLLEEYNEMKAKFNNRRLDLLKADFEAKKELDSVRMDSVANAFNSLIKSKYRYTANFIITHPDYEVSPYLALSEFYDANIKWLDSANKSLSPKIKASKYGKQLEEYVNKIKNEE